MSGDTTMAESPKAKNILYQPDDLAPAKRASGGNVVYGSHKEIYQNLDIIMQLNKAKFPVYLVQSKITKKTYAMKVFGHSNGEPHLYYKNESRFASLQHPNVVRNLYFESERKSRLENVEKQISYIITEYAINGDFFSFMKKNRKYVDEKLARTYFRQLIEGLEFIHQNGVAHMDLKLENLLVGNDYNLKIADFDMAHFKDDAIIIGSGTRNYRGPEVIKGKCNNPKAADIFSAGIVLFALKTKGGFPHFETNTEGGLQFPELLEENPSQFWSEHSKAQRQDDYFDEDFKELFAMMTRTDPKNRATIETIKASRWYNGSHYTPEELKERVERIFSYDRYITTIWEPSL